MKNFKIFLVCTFGILFLAGGLVYTQQYWQKMSGFPSMYVHALAIDGNGRIFAGSFGNGVYRSTDHGTTWIQLISGLTNHKVQSICVQPSGNVFVGTDSGGIYRSIDNGTTWTNVGLNGKAVLSIAIKSSGEIFAGVGFSGIDDGGVFRSTNNGDSWEAVNNGLTSVVVQALAVHPAGYIFAGTGGDGVFRSTDNGANWVQQDLAGFSVTSIAIKPNGLIFGGTYLDGIYYSTDDGATWNDTTQSFSKCRTLAINGSGNIFAGTDREGFFRSANDAACWYSMGFDNEYVRAIVVNSNGFVFVGTDLGIYRTTKTSNQTLAIDMVSLNFDVHVHPPNPYTQSDSFYVRNVTSSPIDISSITVGDPAYTFTPTSATINPGDTSWFLVTFTPKIAGDHPDRINVFSDPTVFPEAIRLNGFAHLPNMRLFSSSLHFGSVNIGTFKDSSYSIQNKGNDILIIDNIVLTNTDFSNVPPIINAAGALEIINNTLRFTPTIMGLVSSVIMIYSNTPTSPDTFIVDGVGLSPTSGVDGNEIPNRFSLGQNHPNPFNPSTTIEFSLPHSGFVSLKVLNILGQEVATLISEYKSAGRYTHLWNADGFPSGTYFYRLQTGSSIETKKLSLIK